MKTISGSLRVINLLFLCLLLLTGCGAVTHSSIEIMAEYDKQELNHVFEKSVSGSAFSWVNPDNGTQYTVTPHPAFAMEGHEICRKADIVAKFLDNSMITNVCTACRDDYGHWTVQEYIETRNKQRANPVVAGQDELETAQNGGKLPLTDDKINSSVKTSPAKGVSAGIIQLALKLDKQGLAELKELASQYEMLRQQGHYREAIAPAKRIKDIMEESLGQHAPPLQQPS